MTCATEAEVRALRDQIDDGTIRVPEELCEVGAEVEVDIHLPGGAAALLTGVAGTSGAAGVSVAIDPLTPQAREAIDRAARELDAPTRRATGYGPEPETARIARMEVPAAAYREEPPASEPHVLKRPPPPIPTLPPAVAKLRSKTSPGVRTGTVAPPRTPTPPPVPITHDDPTPSPASLPEPESPEDFLSANRLPEALAGFHRRVKASVDDRAARVGVELVEGLIARDRGDRFEAAQRFEAALAIDPHDARAAYELTEIRRAVVEARLAGLTKLVEKKD